MLDVNKILEQFLGSGSKGGQGGGSGSLADSLSAGLGGRGSNVPAERPREDRGGVSPWGGGQGSGGGLQGTIENLTKGSLGGVAGGAIAGTLASVLMGGGKSKSPIKMGGSAMKLGGLAILGGLAYKAWRNYQETNQQPPANPAPQPQAGPVQIAPPPQETAFMPSGSEEEQRLGLLLVKAMIAAARADGRIDADEIGKIRDALKAAGADGDEQAFLLDSLGRPDDLDAIAAEARGPELASEVWLAARLTIDPDTPAEQAFLKTLADKLGLGGPLVAHLEQTAAQAKVSGVAAG